MKRIMVLIFLVALIACETQQQQPEQIEIVKYVFQCWDNSTASSFDACPPQPELDVNADSNLTQANLTQANFSEKHITIAQQLLDEATSKFKTHAYLIADRLVIIHGNQSRHYFLNLYKLSDGKYITDVYVNSENKTAVAYCDIERESHMGTHDFDYDRSQCKEYIEVSIPVEYKDWIPKGPLDYLRDFSDIEPVLIEDNTQTVSVAGNSKTAQPTLHYIINGENVIIRIDKRYRVPIKIERDGQQALDFRDTYFDVMMVEGSPQKITKNWVVYQGVAPYWLEFDN